jgi:hypothetical protein
MFRRTLPRWLDKAVPLGRAEPLQPCPAPCWASAGQNNHASQSARIRQTEYYNLCAGRGFRLPRDELIVIGKAISIRRKIAVGGNAAKPEDFGNLLKCRAASKLVTLEDAGDYITKRAMCRPRPCIVRWAQQSLAVMTRANAPFPDGRL